MLSLIILFTIAGSVLSLIGGLILLLKKNLSQSFILGMTGFAAGVLISTAFFDLFPEAMESAPDSSVVFSSALLGMVVFFLFERYFLWFHHHHETPLEIHPSVLLITIGDSIHNFIDGVAIAGAFLMSIPLGITTSIAVAAHEIPQEIADFSVLLSHGVSKKNTLLLNLLSAFTSLLGALLTYFLFNRIEKNLPMIIAFTAGMFTYIASSDLIPELHRSSEKKGSAGAQTAMFLIGIVLVIIVKSVLHE